MPSYSPCSYAQAQQVATYSSWRKKCWSTAADSGLAQCQRRATQKHQRLGGTAKRAELLAVMEPARRAINQQMQQRPHLNQPELAAQYVQMHMAHLPHESFAVLFLDTQHQLICMETLFTGTLNQTSVYPREIARAPRTTTPPACYWHTTTPGCAEPSTADIALTRHLQQALGLLEIAVLDHLIVAQGRTTSMAQSGLMPLA